MDPRPARRKGGAPTKVRSLPHRQTARARTAENVKLLLPPRQSRGTLNLSGQHLDEGAHPGDQLARRRADLPAAFQIGAGDALLLEIIAEQLDVQSAIGAADIGVE